LGLEREVGVVFLILLATLLFFARTVPPVEALANQSLSSRRSKNLKPHAQQQQQQQQRNENPQLVTMPQNMKPHLSICMREFMTYIWRRKKQR